MAAVILLLLLLVLGAAASRGRTSDSRDERFTLGSVFASKVRTDP